MSLTRLISIIKNNAEVSDNLSSSDLATMLDQIRLNAELVGDAERTLQKASADASVEQNFDVDLLLNKIASVLGRETS